MLQYMGRYSVEYPLALMATDEQGSTIIMEPGDCFTVISDDTFVVEATYLTAVEGLSGYHIGVWTIMAVGVEKDETVAEYVKEVK